MLNFLKSFGLGLLYMILSPVLLVILAMYGLYGIYNFFVELIKGLIRFFQGKPFFPPFDEDIKAENILNRGLNPQSETSAPIAPSGGTTNVYVQQNIYQGTPPQQGFPGVNAPNNAAPLPNPTPIPSIPGVDPNAIDLANQHTQALNAPSAPSQEPLPQIPVVTTLKEEEAIEVDPLEEDDENGRF